MVVEVKQLSKHYGTVRAVDGLTFTLEKGQITALLGANGAGKSTTIKMLTGLIKPTKGSLSIFSHTYDQHANAIRSSFGYVPEESAMYEDIGLMDYLYFFASVYNVPRSVAKKRITSLLRRLELDAGNRLIGNLSKGMKRKVLLARSLLHDPPLLIYDEPASGLDPKVARFILGFMKELREQGKAILFSSHHLSHVEQVADTILIMHKGKLLTNKTLHDLVAHATSYVVRYADGTKKQVKGVAELQKEMSSGKVVDVQNKTQSLEDVFLEITR